MNWSNKIFLSVTTLSLLFVLACGSEDIPLPESILNWENELRVEKAIDVETIYSEKGEVKVRLRAPLMLWHKGDVDPYMEFPEGVNVQFYNSQLQETSDLTADYAIKYDTKQEVIMRENVVVTTVKRERIETDELVWSEREKKVRGDKKVKLISTERIISGIGFEAEQDFSYYEIDSVTGIVRIPPDQQSQQ